jgi:hypothetical protein
VVLLGLPGQLPPTAKLMMKNWALPESNGHTAPGSEFKLAGVYVA